MNRLEQDKRAKAEFIINTVAKSSHMRDPLDVIFQVHELNKQMCGFLEEIADALPNRINRDLCTTAIAMIKTQMPIHRYNEEECLFPLLQQHAIEEPELTGIIEHSLWEHGADECVAVELAEMLEELLAGENPKNPEMLGYMLRGFFEGFRRHIAWERVVLLPLARRCLGPIERQTLADQMSKYRVQVKSV